MAERPVTYPESFAIFLSLCNGFQFEIAALLVLDARVLSPGTFVSIAFGVVLFLVTYHVLWWSRGGERNPDTVWTDIERMATAGDVEALDPPYWFRDGLAMVYGFLTTVHVVVFMDNDPYTIPPAVVLGVAMYYAVRWIVVTRASRVYSSEP